MVQDKKKRRPPKKTRHKELSMLGVVEPQKVNAVVPGEWEEIEMAVDIGAGEAVANEDMLESVEIKDGDSKRKGIEYEIADVTLIPNFGGEMFHCCE